MILAYWQATGFWEIMTEMIYYSTKKLVCLIICGFMILLSLAGCGQRDYKTEADETVDKIIDKKWQDDFGSKVNYKISDTQPLSNSIEIEEIIPASGILTLQQAVAIATAHNRQYQTEKELLYISALDLRLARHVFEPQLFGGAGAGYAKDGDDEAIGAQANIGFNRLLASGARFSTNVTVAWIEMLTGNMRSGLTTLISTAIIQPLLRGGDSKIVMENLTQAERDTVYQIRSFNRFRKMFVVSVVSQYYFVLQQLDFLKNAENNHKILTDIYEQTDKLVNAGRLPRHEFDRVRQDRLDAQDIYIQAQKDYKQAFDEFKITLSLPPTVEFKLQENELEALSIVNRPAVNKKREEAKDDLTPEELDMLEEELKLITLIQLDEDDHIKNNSQTQGDRTQQEKIRQHVLDGLKNNSGSTIDTKLQADRKTMDFSETDVLETALALRLDLANKGDAISDAQRKVLVAKDSLRAELNLTAGANVTSRGSSDNITGIGLELDLPLDRMAEANEYRKALITVTQRERDYEEAIDIVVLEVRHAYRDLAKSAKSYRVQLESLELAKKRFDNTFLLLKYGRASSRRVLNAQTDLFRSQNAATQALVDHAVATLNFYRDTGVLQILPDGMWEY
jgi:outer membrane protein TolC